MSKYQYEHKETPRIIELIDIILENLHPKAGWHKFFTIQRADINEQETATIYEIENEYFGGMGSLNDNDFDGELGESIDELRNIVCGITGNTTLKQLMDNWDKRVFKKKILKLK